LADLIDDQKGSQSDRVMIGADLETDVVGADRTGIKAVGSHSGSEKDVDRDRCQTIHRIEALPDGLKPFGFGNGAWRIYGFIGV